MVLEAFASEGTDLVSTLPDLVKKLVKRHGSWMVGDVSDVRTRQKKHRFPKSCKNIEF